MALGVRRAGAAAGLACGLTTSGLVAAVLIRAGWAGLRTGWSEPPALRTPTGLTGAACALAAGLLLTWLGASALLCVLGRLPGQAGRLCAVLSRRVAPGVVRTAVVAILGGTLVAGSAAAASASPRPSPQPASTALPSPGWVGPTAPPAVASITPHPVLPGLPAPTPPPADVQLVSAVPASGRVADADVVVRRGDTLWAIAARHLPGEASTEQIARSWPRWYAANRQVIGPDPDLIRPGQVLRPPAAIEREHP
jgi:resuscitation-promoting factor RpfA